VVHSAAIPSWIVTGGDFNGYTAFNGLFPLTLMSICREVDAFSAAVLIEVCWLKLHSAWISTHLTPLLVSHGLLCQFSLLGLTSLSRQQSATRSLLGQFMSPSFLLVKSPPVLQT
jgi:hypothetical protein